MFEATFIQSTLFKQIIEAMKELVTDANFECTNWGITVQAMESSHISLVSMSISSKAFESYRCDRNVVLGLNVVSVSKILKCVESDDTLSIIGGENEDTVTFCIASKRNDKISNFELKLMNIDAECLCIPEEEADVDVYMASSKYGQLCRDLSRFGDSVKIIAAKTSVQFISEGSLGTAKISLQPLAETLEDDDKEKSEPSLRIEHNDNVKRSYSLKLLNYFSKAASLSKECVMHLSNNSPLCVEYKLCNGDWGHLKYYLAPKMDESEEDKS